MSTGSDFSTFNLAPPPGSHGTGSVPPPHNETQHQPVQTGPKPAQVTPAPAQSQTLKVDTGGPNDFTKFNIGGPPSHATAPPPNKWDDPTYVATQVSKYAKEAGVPENIALAQAHQESSMRMSAVGKDKSGKPISYGVFQIVPSDHPEIKDPHDPVQNIQGGLAILKANYKKYGNWPQALAAYNAGDDAVDKGYWLTAKGYASTRAYVDKILGPGSLEAWQKSRKGQGVLANIRSTLAAGAGDINLAASALTGATVGTAERAAHAVMSHIQEGKGLNLTPAERQAQWTAASLITTPLRGFLRGGFGVDLPAYMPKAGAMTPAMLHEYNSWPPDVRAKWDKQYGHPVAMAQVPENAPIGKVAEWAGTGWGMLHGQRIAENLGLEIAQKAPAVAGVVQKGLSLLPKSGSNYIRLATPVAMGIGGQQAFTQAVHDIYENGYIQPRKETEDFVYGAAFGYLLPATAVLSAKIGGMAMSIAPMMLKVTNPLTSGMGKVAINPLAPFAGGSKPGILGAADKMIAEFAANKTKPIGSWFTGGWEAAANSVNNVYNGFGKVPVVGKGAQQLLGGLRDMGRAMDNFVKYSNKRWQFYSWKYGGAHTFPKDSPLDPQTLGTLLEAQPVTIMGPKAVGRGKGEEPINFGGGIEGAATQSELVRQINGVAGILATQFKSRASASEREVAEYATEELAKGKAYAGPVVQHLRSAVSMLVSNKGRMLPEQWGHVAAQLNAAVDYTTKNGFRNPMFWQRVPSESGLRWTETKEGEYLKTIATFAEEQAHKLDPEQKVSSGIKQGVNQYVLGLGNFGSAATVFSRLGIPLSTEGVENVTDSIFEAKRNTDLFKSAQQSLGYKPFFEVPEEWTSKLVGKKPMQKVWDLGFGMFDYSERNTIPITALSRYFKNTKGGMNTGDAWRDALSYARSIKTSNAYYDLPRNFLGSQGLSPIVKIVTQFFPFALKNAYLVGNMSLKEFGNYMGYMYALGGIKSIPGAQVVDRALTAYLGHSVLQSALANPTYNRILTGVPGMVAGVDVSGRHNFTNMITDHILSASAPVFDSIGMKAGAAYFASMANPTPLNFWRLVMSVMPSSVQGYLKAYESEMLGNVVNTAMNPILKNPNAKELGQMFVGLQPSAVSSREAAQSATLTASQQQQARSEAYLQNYKYALMKGDPQEIAKAEQDARKAGVYYLSLQKARQDVNRSPAYRMVTRIPRSIRRPFVTFEQMFSR